MMFMKILVNATQIRNANIIDNILSKKKLQLIATELFIRGRKLNIDLAFITQCYIVVSKILDLILPITLS